MKNTAHSLPQDTDSLQKLVMMLRSENSHLKLLIAKLKRAQYGRRSESIDPEVLQMVLALSAEENVDNSTSNSHQQDKTPPQSKPVRQSLPKHLPREVVRHEPNTNSCHDCGGELLAIGEDVSETLEYIPASFKVIRHVRPKFSCRCCHKLTQASASERPLPRSIAGPHLLSKVMVSKFCDHLPLYRQSQIYHREGVDLPRSTLADWVQGASQLLNPLVNAIRTHVLSGNALHADDTPVPVLSPGQGKTKTGRFWTYVRDERPAKGESPPAVWFAYSPDRKGIRPQQHLAEFQGIIHADGYAGFNRLFDDAGRHEAACWAHTRRKFFEVHQAQSDPFATKALGFIQQLYRIETEIRGKPPDFRYRQRQQQSVPVLTTFKKWLEKTLCKVSGKSTLGSAIRYALSRWTALTYYCQDGYAEIDNNAAERALRKIALGRKNYLFVGSDKGGERAANLYSVIGTAQLNGLNPLVYLANVFDRISSHPINRIDELLPWNIDMAETEIDAKHEAIKVCQ